MRRHSYLLLLLLLIFLSANFVQAGDERTSIQLSESERNFVLVEMRSFLAGVQQVIAGVTKNDMQQVAESAYKVGMHTAHQVPATLKTKLPIEFKKLGFDTHQKFDQMALDATQVGDKALVLEQLSELMKNCVSCHSMFRFELETK